MTGEPDLCASCGTQFAPEQICDTCKSTGLAGRIAGHITTAVNAIMTEIVDQLRFAVTPPAQHELGEPTRERKTP